MISIKSLPFRDRLTLLNGNFTSIYCFPWTTMSLVETKDRTARIYKEGETEQSLTGILQLPKWCYRLRGIKDNSLLVPNCRQSIGWDVSRYKSKLEKGEREREGRGSSRDGETAGLFELKLTRYDVYKLYGNRFYWKLLLNELDENWIRFL